MIFLRPFKWMGGQGRWMMGGDAGGAAAPPPASHGAAAFRCKTKFASLSITLVSKFCTTMSLSFIYHSTGRKRRRDEILVPHHLLLLHCLLLPSLLLLLWLSSSSGSGRLQLPAAAPAPRCCSNSPLPFQPMLVISRSGWCF